MLTRRTRLWLWVTLGAALTIYAGATVAGAFLFTHPRAARAFVRFRDLPADPDRAEPVTTLSEDGLTLRGSVAGPTNAGGVVLLFHGIGGTRLLGGAQRLAARGLVAVAFDFRGHGTSDGTTTTFGWEEQKDVAAVVRFARARWPDRKLGAWGLSLGGAALCYAAATTRTLDAVVLESVYSTIDSAFERRVASSLPPLLQPLATPCRLLVARIITLDPERMQPIRFTGQLRPERTLITTGANDPWATVGDLEELARPLLGCTTFVVPGAEHHDVWQAGGDAYLDLVRAFLEARLR